MAAYVLSDAQDRRDRMTRVAPGDCHRGRAASFPLRFHPMRCADARMMQYGVRSDRRMDRKGVQ